MARRHIHWGERSLLSYPFKPSTGISGQKLCLLSPQKKGFNCILKDYKTLAQVFTQLWRTSEVYTTEHQYNMGSLYMYIGTLYYEQSTDQHCVLYLFVILIFTPISHWSVHNQNHRLRLIWTFRENPGPTNHQQIHCDNPLHINCHLNPNTVIAPMIKTTDVWHRRPSSLVYSEGTDKTLHILVY